MQTQKTKKSKGPVAQTLTSIKLSEIFVRQMYVQDFLLI